MQSVEFSATGHENIRAVHKTTLEFTKSKDLRLEGDCIVAVNSDFDASQIKELAKSSNRVKIKITAGLFSDCVEANVNKNFDSQDEIVVRMGEFESSRTLGIRSDKGAIHLKRELVDRLKNPNQRIKVRIDAY